MSDSTVIAALGSRAVGVALETVDTKILGDIARSLFSGKGIQQAKLQELAHGSQEFPAIAAVAIGFAAGAAARLAGKDKESVMTDEAFPIAVAAFLAGAAAGAKAVDGKL
ncbi:hypothetical protein BSY239_4119 [Hydrogenophaga sp. RAC07]|uniref:hypothetical protein n=1 Tax=Hydrogenophaga sp. RAC07 TaxID=1842537 RepID=UPI00083CAC5A|nr:hypothetical protein [Hydrogenophaga sp. RAC07]AOF86034.1 hypothetical protein BSY239_4119 [Hydrogenophaga sp. RAC07]